MYVALGILFWKISTFLKDCTAFVFGVQTMVAHFRKFPALENFSCWKFTRWKSVAGNAGKMEKF